MSDAANALHILTAALYRQHDAHGWGSSAVFISSTVLSCDTA